MQSIVKVLLGMIIVLAIALVSIIYFSGFDITGQVIENNLSIYTKAICNETEKGSIFCEDYEISCQGKEISRITPTGNFVYHESKWQDPRGENGSEVTCE